MLKARAWKAAVRYVLFGEICEGQPGHVIPVPNRCTFCRVIADRCIVTEVGQERIEVVAAAEYLVGM